MKKRESYFCLLAMAAAMAIGAWLAFRAPPVPRTSPPPPESAPAAIDEQASDDGRARYAAALRTDPPHGDRAVDALIAFLSDESRLARAAAAGALGRMGDPRAVGPLIRAIEAATPARQARSWRRATRSAGSISRPDGSTS